MCAGGIIANEISIREAHPDTRITVRGKSKIDRTIVLHRVDLRDYR